MLLAFAALVTWFYTSVANSKYGKSMIAVKFNDMAAELLGVNTVKRKVLTVALSSDIAGFCGSLMAFTMGIATPTQFIFGQGVIFVLILILGGSGTVMGVGIGSLILVFLPEVLAPLRFWNTAIYGILVAVIIMVLPGGFASLLLRVPIIQKIYRVFQKKRNDDKIEDIPSILTGKSDNLSQKPVLSVKGAGINFGGLAAMSDVSLDLVPGKIHALIGPNGAGKSTLVNCITGVYKPNSGSLEIDGKSLLGLKPHKISRLGISRTFQNLAVWAGLTSIDNLLVARDGMQTAGFWSTVFNTKKAKKEQAEALAVAKRLMVSMNLWDLRDSYIGTLPYGHQKMLEIARALMTDPKVLLLDEPAAGLTAPEIAILVDLIKTIKNSGVAVLIIDHNMKFVMDIADKITVLNYGKVIASDTPEAVRANEEVISAYLGSGIKRTRRGENA
jgi:ABC-type branched-subunit amino acid transport system ATPase component